MPRAVCTRMRPLVLSRARQQAATRPLPYGRGSAQTLLPLREQDNKRSHPNENRYKFGVRNLEENIGLAVPTLHKCRGQETCWRVLMRFNAEAAFAEIIGHLRLGRPVLQAVAAR